MIKKELYENELFVKINGYIKELEKVFEEKGVIYETNFMIDRYYKKPNPLLYRILSRYVHPLHTLNRNETNDRSQELRNRYGTIEKADSAEKIEEVMHAKDDIEDLDEDQKLV